MINRPNANSVLTFEVFLQHYQNEEVVCMPNKVRPKPLVSVLVITYQHEKYIANCLESILLQRTNFQFEILLGEDDSSDNTRKICLDYAKKYPEIIRLFLHSRRNNIRIDDSPSGRFNYIYNLFMAEGKYFALCDGDDFWVDPYKLQQQVDFLVSNSHFVLHHSSFYKLGTDGKLIKNKKKFHEGTFETLLRENYIVSSSIMFRSENLIIPKWFTESFVGDWALYFILLRNGGNTYYSRKAMIVYRKNIGILQNYKDHFYVLRKILELKSYLQTDPLFNHWKPEIKKSRWETKLKLMAACVKKNEFLKAFFLYMILVPRHPLHVTKTCLYCFKLRLKSIIKICL